MSLRIVYVDDEPDIREIVTFALEDEADMQVRMCASGSEALRSIQADPPDLVLLDVMMPGMDGPSTLRQIRALPGLSDVVAAFVTAKVQPSEVDEFKAMGAIGVIAKPFDPMLLPAQVRDLWARHHA